MIFVVVVIVVIVRCTPHTHTENSLTVYYIYLFFIKFKHNMRIYMFVHLFYMSVILQNKKKNIYMCAREKHCFPRARQKSQVQSIYI